MPIGVGGKKEKISTVEVYFFGISELTSGKKDRVI
jgi:hypothetical protein